ncbi:hypothetical protein [Candidatus Poriferisodalis sp.]|uniref:ORC-CDC6 family AAA ATPase n=1 Tax=Candidatus Poriferisodalis sp. TaxID=3101277 RepID=UPI003B02519E
MRTLHNPFLSRASEQERETFDFLRHVGAAVLELLPDSLWDRPLIIRSASGGGKTTLLRVFTAESLREVNVRRDDLRDLAEQLDRVGALADNPTHLGVLLNLSRDYRTIAMSGAPPGIADRLFLRLLDARIVSAVVRAAVGSCAGRYPDDVGRLHLELDDSDERAAVAADQLGGLDGTALVGASRAIESEIVEILDSLKPVDWDRAARGHSQLHSLRLLSSAELLFDNQTVPPVHLLFDDGHALAEDQRAAVLTALQDRRLTVARWYAERLSALDSSEVLQGETRGRDYELLELERATRVNARGGGRRFDRILREVGNLRAGWHIDQYTRSQRDFFEFLDSPVVVEDAQLEAIRNSAKEAAGSNTLHARWVDEATGKTALESAVLLRGAEILMERSRNKPQQTLFDPAEGPALAEELGSDVKGAARLFLAREHDVPYYAGADTITRVASENVEQFLRVCGEVFEYMLAKITLDEPPTVPVEEQDRILRFASERMWRELPDRLPRYADVIRLVNRIARIAEQQTQRPTAPYPPGVNGIAITMEDRTRLLNPGTRDRIPGGERLFEALGVAVARNVLVADVDYSVKKKRVMVLYLNRLLCPRLSLPLSRGSFREQKVTEVAGWLLDGDDAEPTAPEPPLFDL